MIRPYTVHMFMHIYVPYIGPGTKFLQKLQNINFHELGSPVWTLIMLVSFPSQLMQSPVLVSSYYYIVIAIYNLQILRNYKSKGVTQLRKILS